MLLSQQQFVLTVLLRAAVAPMRGLATDVETEERNAIGHYAQEVEEEIQHHLPRLHLLMLLLVDALGARPLNRSAVEIVLTVDPVAAEAASKSLRGYEDLRSR
jgi:uracil phosphoribosyltransferase